MQLTREGVRENSSPSRIQPAPLLQTQDFRRKNVTEFLVVSDCSSMFLGYLAP